MSASVSGDVVFVIKPDGSTVTMSTYCPDHGIKTFFQFYPEINKADFQLWKRTFKAYNHELEYHKKALGTFTRKQVEAAGENPVAQVVDLVSEMPAVVAKARAQNDSGASSYGRTKELAKQGLTKQAALLVLQQEFPERPEARLKGMIHSVWAQAAKEVK